MTVQRIARWLAAGLLLVTGCTQPTSDAPKKTSMSTLAPLTSGSAASAAPNKASPPAMHVESASASPSISQFALYATGSVELNGGSYVHGCDVGVENTSGPYIDSSWSAYLNSSANIDTTHTLYAASVYMNAGVTIGPIDTNNFFHQGTSTYGAVNTFPTSMPAAPTMPSATAGSTSVNLNSGVTQTLAAGPYGSVMINSGATLNLSGGTYVFSQLTMNGGNVNVQAATTLSITGSVTMGSGAYMGPASGSGLTAKSLNLYLSSSSGININSNFELHALLVATNELVQVNTSKFYGAIAAQEIRMNSGATVTCQDGFGSSSCSGSCDDGNACTTDACSGGTCTHTPVTNGTACNDGNACTQTDTCQAGACTGSNPVVCTASDQCHVAGTCNAGTGACTNPAATNGTTCNDGNACTQTDTCQSGTCSGANPVTCAASDQCHVAGTCNASTGACSNPAATNGTTCNDGNACTQTDTCQSGTCGGSNPVVCTASDQCHTAGICNASTGACSNPVATNGTTCNDGNACTQTDTCQSGTCTGSNPVVCSASDQCHVAGTCNTSTGACTNPTASNGTACNDGNACTRTDTCQSGTCGGSNPVVCTASDPCHTAGSCNTSTGACSNPSAANGTPCNDGNACTQTDSCQSGTCTGSNSVVCTASDQCHVAGTCNTTSGACTNPLATNGTTCNDGNACTQTDTCQSGTCTGSNPVTCTAEDQCHSAGMCSSSTGTCSQPALANGTTCNDGNPNTVNDVCTAGVCAGTDYCIGVTCTASDQCHTVGVCNHATGVCSNPAATNGTSCNDGNACTQTDTCQSGTCTGSNPVVCAAEDQCHVAGTCNTSTGACTNPTAANGTTCNDGNACTQTDTCQSGTCTGSNPVTCSASDQCHVAGTCNTSTGACTNPTAANGTSCSDGNACTQTDTCQSGVCAGSNPVTCTASDQCHVAGTCNTSTGACTNPAATNGTTCSDGNACTQTDTCQSGTCTGSNPVTCTAEDQCHSAGVCSSSTGTCSQPTLANGTTCNDGNPNTVNDVCTAGACAGTDYCVGVTCTASDQCHGVGTCNHATGACSNPALANGTNCNDGNACTQTDTCQSGTCTGTNPVTCTAEDQCHAAGVCSASTGTCSQPALANGTTCNDGNPNTINDVCTAGVCAGTDYCVGVTCTASDQCHAVGTCNHATGVCSNPALANGTTCNDGNACTQTDTCQAGTCTGSNPVTCTAEDQCHVAGTCNTSTGTCSNPTASNGTTCSDGNACTQTDTCQSGTCVGSSPVTCSASDQCHSAGTCDSTSGKCSNPALVNGTPCSDGNACTQTDTCQSGTCTGSSPVTCSASDQCHVAGACNTTTGTCSNPTAANGTTCNDGNACTRTDICQSGTCTGTSPVTCSASDQCHSAGTCDPISGACSNPALANGTSCSDGNACTQNDVCTAGACVSGTAVACAASDQCHTAGTCNSTTGSCSNPAASNGTACSDGNACTLVDACQSGTCVGSSPVVCTASDQCHVVGACNTSTGVCSNPAATNGTTCNDGNACTQTDTCQSGTCAGTNAVTCSAGDQCHAAGVCDTSSGKCSNPAVADGTTCNDGNACTTGESCVSGVCSSSKAVTCPATDACHLAGTCNTSTGACTNPVAPDGTLCTDGNACTQTDKCAAGVCHGSNPVICGPLDQCHVAGACDTATGLCSSPNAVDGKRCDDGNFCTRTDTCEAGACSGANPVVCVAQDACHEVGACDTATGSCSNPVAPDSATCKGGVLFSGNLPPVVNAGASQTVTPGTLVTLTGVATDDGKPAPLTLDWVQLSGPTNIVIATPTVATVSFVVPLQGVYAFRLKASDSQYVVSSDVTVTATLPGSGTTYDPGDPGTGTESGTTGDGTQLSLLASTYSFNFIWVPVTSRGTVVKIDADSGRIVGEYWSAPLGQANGPSRTAVDKNGSVWVANRDSNSVTRIAHAQSGLCVDRNGNGTIDTSTAQNDVRPWTNEGGADTTGGVTTAADECVINYTIVSSYGARQVSVNGSNDVWVTGTGTPGRLFDLLDGKTGVIKRHENTVNYGGFGGFVDDHGILWSAGPLLRWDPSQPLAGAPGTAWVGINGDSYGICKDLEGNVWSTSDSTTVISKFSPAGVLLTQLDRGLQSMRSCVVDNNDDVWISYGNDPNAAVARMKSDGTLVGSVTAGAGTSGLSVDAHGKIWVANCSGNTASRIDPKAGPIGGDGVTTIGKADFTTVDLLGSPVDYSGMTGSISATGPNNGSWTATFNSGTPASTWGSLTWGSWICGDEILAIQAASSLDGVTYSKAVSVTNGTAFSLPNGPYVQVTAAFARSSKGESPLLTDVNLSTLDRPVTIQPNKPPVVSAGIPVTVNLPSLGHLVGSACDDGLPKGVIAPMWTLVSGPTGATATFLTPGAEVTDVIFSAAGTYVVRLTGNDTVLTAKSDVTVTVLAPNMPPIVSAGPNQSVVFPAAVTLAGTATDDGLPAGGTLTTSWSMSSGPGAVTFASATSLSTTATFSVPGNYVLALTANDTQASSISTVAITVNPPPVVNQPPSVNAGSNITIQLTDTATLTGLVTDDSLPIGSTVTQLWSQVTGPGVVAFGDSTQALTTATFNAVGTYILQLTATDTQLSASAQIAVVVVAPADSDAGTATATPPIGNLPPSVNAGPNLATTLPNATVQLNGVAADDGLPTGSVLTTLWSKVNGPGTVTFGNSTLATTTASLSVAGTYVLRLTASDSQFTTTSDVVVTVNAAVVGNAPPVVSAGTGLTLTLPTLSANLAGSATDDGNPVGSTLTTTWSLASGPGSATFGDATALSTTVTFSGTGRYIVRLTASDGQLTSASDVVFTVLPTSSVNQPPTIDVGPPQAVYLPTQTAVLEALVTDDGLPIGGTLTTTWEQESGPDAATVSGNMATFTTTVGTYTFRVIAFDGALTSSAVVTVTLSEPAPPNQPPVVSAGSNLTVTLPAEAMLVGSVRDDGLPAGETLTQLWSLVSGPGDATFDASTSVATGVSFTTAGTYVLSLTANDGEYSTSSNVTITALPANLPPVVTIAPVAALTFPATTTTLVGTVTDDGLPAGGKLTQHWSTVNGPDNAIFAQPSAATTSASFPAPGTYVLALTANDGQLNGEGFVVVSVTAPTAEAGAAPVVAFTTDSGGNLVQDGLQVTAPTPITGYVSDGAWTLDIALGDADSVPNGGWLTIGHGNGLVNNTTLATLDPTLRLNGTYSVRLTSTNSAGSAVAYISVTIARNMKVGVFALAFNDLTVGAQGLPIQVQRTYDSRDKTVGDFGVGWHLAAQNIRVEKSVSLGKFWYQFQDQTGFDTYYLSSTRDAVVTITFPSGKVYQFQLQVSPSASFAFPFNGQGLDAIYQPINGTVGSLFPTMGTEIMVPEDAQYNVPFSLMDLDGNVYNPTTFTLTDENGISYVVDQMAGLSSITDLNGNTLTFSPAGISSSCGRGITIVRDSNNRITSITDANGNVQTYAYDAVGDLVTYTDRTGNTQSFTYDDQHDMATAVDGKGVTLANFSYDSNGRFVGSVDALSNQTTFEHDLATNTDIVTDANGKKTYYTYDNDGNVTKKIDANGKEWDSTFDANDNQLSAKDPLGNTTYMEWDSLNNKTADVDAYGKRTTYTWIINHKMTSKTDPLLRTTTWNYDYYANLLYSQVNPISTEATTYGYDLAGNLTDKYDPNGNHTSYAPDGFGHNGQVTDPMGHTVSYTYDTNGNQLTKSETRTKADLSVETLLTTWTYDASNRVTKTVYPDGSSTSTTFDQNGHQLTSTDQLNQTTSYVYDDLGRLIETDYPDTFSEKTTYDALGRRYQTTDKAGRITTYHYDPVGRLIETDYPDGTNTQTAYDDAGRVIAQTNENGHTTSFGYDNDGRRTTVTDATGFTTTTAYDDAGQVVSVTDANGNAMSYLYDADSRQTRMTYADGTYAQTVYDVDGNRTQSIDQAFVTTNYGYDADNRLTSVTDALSGVTKYGYDELGNKISQTDANGHVTKYAFDQMGRRVSRSLPLGQTESMAYDGGGELTAKTDFAGKTTGFSYDVDRRMTRRSADPSFHETDVQWSYTATGRRNTMTDSTGVTSYAYDNRDRLLSKATPEGTLFYTRDLAGHVASTRSDASDGVAVDYEWDADERLSEVIERGPGAPTAGLVTKYGYDKAGRPLGWTQPSGVTTTLSYDVENRLTNETIKRADGTSINSYTYALSPTGNRTGVTEGSGRTIAWTYDTLYRLTGETISGSASANGVVTYGYDAVGNRLSRTSTLAGVPTTASTFDQDDRIAGETFNSNGDQTTREGRTQSFDSQDRLTSASGTGVSSVSVNYSGDDSRVSEIVDGAAVAYLVDDQNPTGWSQVVETRVGGAVQQVFVFGSKAVSLRTKAGASWNTSYYEQDGHGSVVALTDAAGAVTDTYEYDAFGTVAGRVGTSANPILYSGEWIDAGLGLQYLRARWYQMGAGRFESQDTMIMDAARDRLIPRYSYASNEPVGRIDPGGHEDMTSLQVAAMATGALANLAAASRVAYLGFQQGRTADFLTAVISGQWKATLMTIPLFGTPYAISTISRAGDIIDQAKAAQPTVRERYDYLLGIRNQSLEASQDLALAAAEHYFVVQDAGLVGGAAYIYLDYLKGVLGFLSMGIFPPLLSAGAYPSTPATPASMFWEIAAELGH